MEEPSPLQLWDTPTFSRRPNRRVRKAKAGNTLIHQAQVHRTQDLEPEEVEAEGETRVG